MMPSGETRRTTWSKREDTNTLPSAPTASPSGSPTAAAVAGVPVPADPGDGGDDPVGPDPADAVVLVALADVETAVRADGDRARREVALGRRPTVAREPDSRSPRDRRDRAVGRDPADPVVEAVGDVEAAVRGDRHGFGSVER